MHHRPSAAGQLHRQGSSHCWRVEEHQEEEHQEEGRQEARKEVAREVVGETAEVVVVAALRMCTG